MNVFALISARSWLTAAGAIVVGLAGRACGAGLFALTNTVLHRPERREQWDYMRTKFRILPERRPQRNPLQGVRSEIYQAMVVVANYRVLDRRLRADLKRAQAGPGV
jgi:hypothetical protein